MTRKRLMSFCGDLANPPRPCPKCAAPCRKLYTPDPQGDYWCANCEIAFHPDFDPARPKESRLLDALWEANRARTCPK